MACSCGSSGRKSFVQIVQQDGSSLPALKYLHCKYQEQFEYLFAKIGVNASESNLKLLAYAYDNGLDRKGSITNSEGNPIYFSIEDVLKRIDSSKVSNISCAI